MFRYEITGSGVGSSEALPIDQQIEIVRKAGGINPRARTGTMGGVINL